MKTLLFIVLKVLEVVAIVAAYFVMCTIGFFTDKLFYDTPNQKMCWNSHELYRIENFAIALMDVVVIFVLLMIIFVVIPKWFKLNKKWVDKILKN